MILCGADVVTPARVVHDGWVEVCGGRITRVGQGPPPAGVTLDLGGMWLVPGFVDLHVHGGGGHDMAAGPDQLDAAVRFHRRRGTTSTLVSLVAAPVDDLVDQLSYVADVAGAPARGLEGGVLGAHLEGPFLSAGQCGAQNPDHLIDPDTTVLDRLVAAARGALRVVTVAPERPGGMALVKAVQAHGAVPAIGHTDAAYEVAAEAIAAGARLATHLFNGMRVMHHREPGAAGAALASDAVCEVINDGVHVHPAWVSVVAEQPGRLALVTDAVSAAGLPDGKGMLGDQPVTIRDGEVRLDRTGSLAGSTLTMDEAFRRAVQVSGLSMVQAARAAATTPAEVLRMRNRLGAISEGLSADFVVLDEALRVSSVIAGGQLVSGL